MHMRDFNTVMSRLRRELGLGDIDELRPILGIKSSTFSTWKSRSTVPYEAIINYWLQRDMIFDLKYVITGIKAKKSALIHHGPGLIENATTVSMPFLGFISAGEPILSFPSPELIEIPEMFDGEDRYALRVRGDSMVDAGVLDGDILIIHQAPSARSNDMVIGLLNGEAALKRLVRKRGKIELNPANPYYPVITVTPDDDFRIQGIVVGIIRQF